MPHLLEKAPTGRAKCRGCGRAIAAGEWRLGERLPNPYADAEGAEMTHWFHPACAAFKRPEPFLEVMAASSEPIADRASLEQEARLGVEHRRLPRVDVVSRAPSGRATCRSCKEPIAKDAWRIGLVYYEDGRFAPSGYIHLACAKPYLETTDLLARVRHFSPQLSADDLAEVRALLAPAV
jgi:Poly(ADP-ribose) polymerase and DNA-Ligase Zn-finger region